jgi:hypothetical protein
MNWLKLIMGLCGVVACFIAFVAYQVIAYYYAQQHCDAEGDVCYGIQVQMVTDMFHAQFGRYPTIGELTNLLEITVEAMPFTTNRNSSARWFYDEKSGEISVNTSGKYRVGPYSVMDLSDTHFRHPTEVREIRFGRVETLDYSWANIRFNNERPEITEVMTNWYTTNALQLHAEHTER